MPAPVAKGIIITVSVLVAAGLALYESPQFQEWLSTSRRKIALALHNLGDEIHPRDTSTPLRDDISMTEDDSPAAAERRRLAREEILRRGAEARRRRQDRGSLGTFDTLVDEDGNLRADEGAAEDAALGASTALDLHGSQTVKRVHERQDASEPQTQPEHAPVDGVARSGAELLPPLKTSFHSPSEPLVDLTPTSDESEFPFGGRSLSEHHAFGSQTGFFSVRSRQSSLSSSHGSGAGRSPEIYYAHPDHLNSPNDTTDLRSPISGTLDFASDVGQHSSAASTAGSFSHIGDTATDGFSDGTLSEVDHLHDGTATPASWSEIGSVISGDDAGHH